MSNKWIDKDDDFGIRLALKEIYAGEGKKVENIFFFDVWVNQYLPPPFYTTKSTILRHIDEIKAIKRGQAVWIVRNGQFQGISEDITKNRELSRQLKEGMIRLPTYYEIQEELQKIQSHPKYNKKEKGVNPLPVEEEYVQLSIKHR